MLWALLSVLSGLGDAFIFALMKKLKGTNSSMVVWVQYAFAMPILLFLLYLNFPQKINTNVYWVGFLNAILLLVSTYLLVKAAQISDLSISMPMLSFTPLFLVFTSYVMLKEVPTLYGFIGVLLIVIGAYIINIKSYKKGVLEPFLLLFKNKGPFYILIVASIWSITANLFKTGILSSNVIFFTTLVYAIISLVMLPLFYFKLKEKIKEIKINFKKLLLLGISSGFAVLLAAYAMLTAIVPYVISLKRSSVIFAIFFGYFMFKEKNIKDVMIGTVIMLIGGVLITLF